MDVIADTRQTTAQQHPALELKRMGQDQYKVACCSYGALALAGLPGGIMGWPIISSVGSLCSVCTVVMGVQNRTQVHKAINPADFRERHMESCCLHCCCRPCALAQEKRAMEMLRGFKPLPTLVPQPPMHQSMHH
jgi:hypothetical protein